MSEITDELIWEQQDQIQRIGLMVSALCRKAGIDPEEAGRLPDEPPENARAA